MHISAIRIRNFRNFAVLDLDGLTPALVVAGENRVGKSNLLHALRLVLDPALTDAARSLRAEDFWNGLEAPFGGASVRVEVELSGYEADVNAKAVLSDSTVGRDPLVARLTYVFRPRSLPDGTQPGGADPYEFILFGGGDENNRLGSELRRYIGLHVLPALRDAEGDLQNWNRSPLRRLLQRLEIPDERLDALMADITSASLGLLEDPQVSALNSAIATCVEEMVGDLFKVETSLGIAAARTDQVLRSVRMFVEGERSISETGLGSANVIFLALLLQDVAAQVKVGDIVTTILGVEEPEAHLHPHLQRVLFRYLLRSQAALLLTTHSSHIASVTPLRSLAVLRGGTTGTTGHTIRSSGLVETEVRDLERYLDVTRADLIFAKGAILVEGPAELYVVPALAVQMGHDLDALGITVCSVHGADFRPYRRLLGVDALSVPNVVITDGDSDPDRRNLEHAGLRRGCALLGEPAQTESREALGRDDLGAVRTSLDASAIFVGEHTLEIDLLPAALNPMRLAFNELAASASAQQRFSDAAQAAGGGSAEDRKLLVQMIERVGKGRYAQRLAEHLQGIQAPAYIARAIEAIVTEVRSRG